MTLNSIPFPLALTGQSELLRHLVIRPLSERQDCMLKQGRQKVTKIEGVISNTKYSQLPNKWAGPNKRAGAQIF